MIVQYAVLSAIAVFITASKGWHFSNSHSENALLRTWKYKEKQLGGDGVNKNVAALSSFCNTQSVNGSHKTEEDLKNEDVARRLAAASKLHAHKDALERQNSQTSEEKRKVEDVAGRLDAAAQLERLAAEDAAIDSLAEKQNCIKEEMAKLEDVARRIVGQKALGETSEKSDSAAEEAELVRLKKALEEENESAKVAEKSLEEHVKEAGSAITQSPEKSAVIDELKNQETKLQAELAQVDCEEEETLKHLTEGLANGLSDLGNMSLEERRKFISVAKAAASSPKERATFPQLLDQELDSQDAMQSAKSALEKLDKASSKLKQCVTISNEVFATLDALGRNKMPPDPCFALNEAKHAQEKIRLAEDLLGEVHNIAEDTKQMAMEARKAADLTMTDLEDPCDEEAPNATPHNEREKRLAEQTAAGALQQIKTLQTRFNALAIETQQVVTMIADIRHAADINVEKYSKDCQEPIPPHKDPEEDPCLTRSGDLPDACEHEEGHELQPLRTAAELREDTAIDLGESTGYDFRHF